jgi:hypothetical protein
MEKPLKRRCAAIIVSVLTVWAAGVNARGVDSLCVQFIGSVGGAAVELKAGRTITGSVPVTLCDLRANAKYRMTVAGGTVERRAGTLNLGERGVKGVGGLRLGSAGRNVILPGWGFVFSDRPTAGVSDGLCVAAAAWQFLQENQEYRHLKNRLDLLNGMLSLATTVEDRQRIEDAAHVAAREVNIQNRHRKRLAAVAAGLYACQVLDPLLSDAPPRCTIEGGGTVVRLDGPGVSRVKGFVHSLIRPGSGQFYEGKPVRGLFFSLTTVAGGLVALEYHNRYDEAVGRYETCVERFDASDNIAEKERLSNEAARLWDDVEQQKEYRTGAYAVLAGLWAWNLIDTLFPGGNGDTHARYSFNAEARGLAFVLRF